MYESSSSPKSRFLTSFNDVKSEQQSAGRFVLATNVLDEAILDNSEIISEYKAQQLCEWGFGSLKDPLFFTPCHQLGEQPTSGSNTGEYWRWS